jgi:hypothetical protein
MVATTFVALAIAPIWDRTIFVQALDEALRGDPEVAQSVGDAAADPMPISGKRGLSALNNETRPGIRNPSARHYAKNYVY